MLTKTPFVDKNGMFLIGVLVMVFFKKSSSIQTIIEYPYFVNSVNKMSTERGGDR